MKRQTDWLNQAAEQLENKMRAVRERSARKIPAMAVNGVHDNKADGREYPADNGINWWTNGFWAALLWQMYHATGDARYAEIAAFTEEQLDAGFMSFYGLHHDIGFMWHISAGANYRITGSADAKRRALHAANLLAGRYNCNGKFIRAWNDIPGSDADTRGWVIIDSMLNIPLLYWASRETGDPRFQAIALAHANTVQTHFIRADGSVRHIVEFDPHTGAFVTDYGGQGMATGSSWTRGQSWGLYGFALSYLHTENPAFLSAAETIAAYVLAQLPENALLPCDFCQPPDCVYEDSIAGAVIACAFLQLAKANTPNKQLYQSTANRLVYALYQHRCDFSLETDGILTHCTPAYHGETHNVNYTYGDYFFVEALYRLLEKDVLLW